MALIPIMGQPVNLVPNNERAFGCEPENSFCALYAKAEGEVIAVQMIQTPCDPTLVTNGTFITDTGWTYDANVVIAGQKATHVVGTTGEIYQDIYGALGAGDYVSLMFSVTGMGAGTIDVHVGETAATYTITENGIYTFYLKPELDDTLLLFEFSADCDGSISSISSFKLYRESDVSAYLLDASGVIVRTLTTILLEDRIVFSIPTFLIDEGCYTIQVADPCTVALTTLTERFVDYDFQDAGAWTVATNSGTAIISADHFKTVTGATTPTRATAIQAFNIPQGVRLYVEMRIDVNVSSYADIEAGIFIEDGGDTIDLMRVTNPTTVLIRRIWEAGYPPEYLNMGAFIEDSSGNVGVNNWMTTVSLKTALASDVDGIFESNCIKIASDVSGTQLVKGTADEVATYPLPNKSLGFLFHRDIFWLQARLALQFSNPHSPIKTENYLYSSGRKKKAYAQVGKAWDLTFHAVDENMHDTIANIINCDVFTINGNQYITDEKEYTANYGPKGVDPVGESTIEVQKIDNTRFNTNV
jgi:hypothetical protein